jgi:mycofactocin precursor
MAQTTAPTTDVAVRPDDVAPPEAPMVAPEGEERPATLVEADVLVEDVSIDGMCGVY